MAFEVPRTMHAWRKHTRNLEPQWDEVPVPSAPPNGYLLRVLAAGVCHSDYMLVKSEQQAPGMQGTYILGHEGCGEVVAVGSELAQGSAKFKLGDVVAIHPGSGMQRDECWGCTREAPKPKHGQINHGLGMDGSFAKYVAVLEEALVPVPKGITPAQAAVATDAIMTAHHAIVHRGKVEAKDTVFVFGLGGLGLNAVQILLAIGARVIVSDTRQGPLDEAVRLGVLEQDVVPVGSSIPEFVGKHQLSIDIVADFVCIPQTFSNAQEIGKQSSHSCPPTTSTDLFLVRHGGTILAIGLLGPEIPLNTLACVFKQVDIKFCYGGHTSDIADGLDLIVNGKLTPRVEEAKLEEFPRVLQDLHEGKIKSRMALIP